MGEEGAGGEVDTAFQPHDFLAAVHHALLGPVRIGLQEQRSRTNLA